MIVMLISETNEKEASALYRVAKDKAAIYTEEKWDWIYCNSIEKLNEQLEAETPVDMYCLDITMKNAIEVIIKLRKNTPDAYMILIAEPRISPLVYMRPSIHAESLMLRPLSMNQIQSVLDEAVSQMADRLQQGTENTFTVECRGEKSRFYYHQIAYFEAREKKVFLNTGDEEYGFSDTLDRLNEELDDMFIRVHRSFLVNKKKIRNIYLSQNRMVLDDDIEIPLARSYKPVIKEFMEGRKEDDRSKSQKLDTIL